MVVAWPPRPLPVPPDDLHDAFVLRPPVEADAAALARAWAVPGTTRQPPPDKNRPDVMSDFIRDGEWGPAFNAQNAMLDAYAEAAE